MLLLLWPHTYGGADTHDGHIVWKDSPKKRQKSLRKKVKRAPSEAGEIVALLEENRVDAIEARLEDLETRRRIALLEETVLFIENERDRAINQARADAVTKAAEKQRIEDEERYYKQLHEAVDRLIAHARYLEELDIDEEALAIILADEDAEDFEIVKVN